MVLFSRCCIVEYVKIKASNFIAKTSGHVEDSRAFSRYRDIGEEMAKEVILK